MCGISGIINQKNKQIDYCEIKNMNDLIIHRGPDDEGFFFGKNFAFGHRRLSILDLTKDGRQPMSYLDGKYTITYNGEIYNYIEIRNELLLDGYKFFSKTDTEVILASYDKWGEDCVNKFNGMWAFAIYDRDKNIIFCSRDRFGVKPFYYTEVNDKFIFGSEIKQLLEFYSDRFVNKNILIDYLVTGFEEHTNETFFENIHKLQQSHNLIYDLSSNTFEIKKYYDIKIDKEVEKLNENESINLLAGNLTRSIELRLRSDVKVGTCLSGGLDSSAVAAFASKEYNKNSEDKFLAIHAKSIEKKTDESKFAQIVAENCNLNLQIVEPTLDDFKNNIDEVVYTQEEPFGGPSIFMQYFVMKKAKELNCQVMLDGQGGDETLLGYEKYYPAIYIDIFKKFGLLRAIKEIRNSNKNNSKMSIKWILTYFAGTIFSKLRKVEYRRRIPFLKPFQNQFLFLDHLSKKYFDINELQKYEINSTNLPALLRYEDKNSMRHSVETRLPFIDYISLENSLSLNTIYKIKDGWTKYILRKVIDKFMPSDIVWRKNKFGFNAPNDTWLSGIKEDMKKEICRSKILVFISDIKSMVDGFNSFDERTKWRIYNVAVWERIYNVKINLNES
ncbi:MAG: asparagine synthase (glutamine-hydrolyzing) [Bacteroidota bacterium]|nr:asparagine synthase (glutamine-hydrolyzing) [Bacteroidota bacterium]